MPVIVSFPYHTKLVEIRRQTAPNAVWDRVTKRWTMSQAEYARFWTALVGARFDPERLIVHHADGA